MKLLLLTAGVILSNLCFSQQLKPEIKELMKQTELNPPNGLIYSENNREQRLHPAFSTERLDTVPKNKIQKVDGQYFDFRKLLQGKSLLVPKKKGTVVNPKEPGIYLLPQDNMPCIVPDTKDIAAIHNLWKGKVEVPYRSNIPNPSLTPRPVFPNIHILPKGDTK